MFPASKISHKVTKMKGRLTLWLTHWSTSSVKPLKKLPLCEGKTRSPKIKSTEIECLNLNYSEKHIALKYSQQFLELYDK